MDERWSVIMEALFVAVGGGLAKLDLAAADVRVDAETMEQAVAKATAKVGDVRFVGLDIYRDLEFMTNEGDKDMVTKASLYPHGTGLYNIQVVMVYDLETGAEWHRNEFTGELEDLLAVAAM